jgi:transcriptional regulator with XRE-family HTH domain
MVSAVRILRTAKGQTQTDLAKASRLDPAVLSRIENGHSPNRRHTQRLARALDLKVDNLERAIQLTQDLR